MVGGIYIWILKVWKDLKMLFIHDVRPLYSCLDLEREPMHAQISEDNLEKPNLKNGNNIVMWHIQRTKFAEKGGKDNLKINVK